jgi:DNA-binding LacI/PurR family transcriptional regulator
MRGRSAGRRSVIGVTKRLDNACVLIRISSVAKRSSAAQRRVTTHDVAARAGVSQPTVSLVLSRNPTARVAAGTRERVIRAAEELGYRPNVVARSLVRRRSYAIGLVVPDLSNQFFAHVVSGAQRVAVDEGYAVLLCEQSSTPIDRHLDALRARQVDGVILDAAGASSIPEELLDGINVVLIDQPSERWPGVASDAEGAGRMAAEHLLTLGHRRVAFIGPSADVHTFRMRERGFTRAIRGAGIGVDADLFRRAPATVAGGHAAMRALLAQRTPPTAVFCANDLMALGAYKACGQAGVSIPRDISIVGCDDIEFAQLVTPELTTIAIPARELGARAARLLVRALAGDPAPPSQNARPLPVRLVTRGSTAPPAAATTDGKGPLGDAAR